MQKRTETNTNWHVMICCHWGREPSGVVERNYSQCTYGRNVKIDNIGATQTGRGQQVERMKLIVSPLGSVAEVGGVTKAKQRNWKCGLALNRALAKQSVGWENVRGRGQLPRGDHLKYDKWPVWREHSEFWVMTRRWGISHNESILVL